MALGETLPFGSPQMDTYLDDNWHQGEEDGRWTAESQAEITFLPPPDQHKPLVLRIHAGPLQPDCDVNFLVDGAQVLSHRYTDFDHVDLPLGTPSGDPIRIGIVVPGITSPQALGTASDSRLLGLKVASLLLLETPPAEQDPPLEHSTGHNG
jgi:hypothetical protein